MEVQSSNIYTSLDSVNSEIRLVRLKSQQYTLAQGLSTSHILCDLQHSHLADDESNHTLPYTALSYAWGAEHDAAAITLCGQDRRVSANLYYALHELRQEHQDVLLWVDQLSINQDDDVEKSRQVQMMKQIFEQAQEVVAWVGVESDRSEVIMCTLRHIATLGDLDSRTLLVDVARDLGLLDGHDAAEIVQGMVDIMVHALPAFTSRSYWCRLWVLQEFVVATKLTVLCGGQRIRDREFETGWKLLGKYLRENVITNDDGSDNVVSDLQLLGLIWRSCDGWWDSWLSITRLIHQRRSFLQRDKSWHPEAELLYMVMYKTLTTFAGQYQMLCADSRDRVFSLLGLAKDAAEYISFPDYTRSFESIYTEVSQTFLKQGHSNILGFCQTLPEERSSDMPSWCVDWTRKIRLPISGKLNIDASHGCKFALNCQIIDDSSISLTGTCIGRIADHGSQWQHEQPLDWQQVHTYLEELKQFCSQSPLIRSREREVVCAFLAAPATLAYVQSNQDMLAEYRQVVKFLQDSNFNQHSMKANPDVGGLSPYARELRFQLFRCPFITDQGQVGIAPPFVEIGDIICIFPGGCATYVLRSMGQNAYMFISGSHVHGIMHGEYFKEERMGRSFTLI